MTLQGLLVPEGVIVPDVEFFETDKWMATLNVMLLAIL
jgi:hypothetical protein